MWSKERAEREQHKIELKMYMDCHAQGHEERHTLLLSRVETLEQKTRVASGSSAPCMKVIEVPPASAPVASSSMPNVDTALASVSQLEDVDRRLSGEIQQESAARKASIKELSDVVSKDITGLRRISAGLQEMGNVKTEGTGGSAGSWWFYGGSGPADD